MNPDSIQYRFASIENVSPVEVEAESLEVVSSSGDILTRLELDIACSSEKLVNLEILLMHVAWRENDLEVFVSEEGHMLEGSIVKALEFDHLHGILDSEVRELENFLSFIQIEIFNFQEVLSSVKKRSDIFKDVEDRLQDCEDFLKKLFERVADIKMQSANVWRILLDSSGKDGSGSGGLGNGGFSDLRTEIKMQTEKQQRRILRMLERSLGGEIELEKRLIESREIEEDLKLRLQQEVFCMEQEAEYMWGKLFEAENSSEIFLGISKELFGQIQTAQFSINGSIQKEGELRSKLQYFAEQLKEKEFALQCSEGANTELVERVNSLEQKLRELESQLRVKDSSDQNNELKDKSSAAENRAVVAEAECKFLRDSSMELNTDLRRLKSSIADTSKKVEQLEKQLKESEIKRLHAVASAEASQEKQSLLDCIIKDLENLIQDLKAKVLRAENQTETAEEKCIILSESNEELTEEIHFFRHKMEYLETSLHQTDEAKNESVNDIKLHTKLITDLVLELGLERERLHKQITSLSKEKNTALKYLQKMKDPSVPVIGSHDTKVREVLVSENDIKSGTPGKESNEEIMESKAAGSEIQTY